MSKQTALQQFIDKITSNHDKHFKDFYKAEIEEALQMEREQIVNTFKDAQVFKMMEYEIRGEQYYKQTYGGQDESK
jgi:DNA-directed RNA polymerase specialized sigma subunit